MNDQEETIESLLQQLKSEREKSAAAVKGHKDIMARVTESPKYKALKQAEKIADDNASQITAKLLLLARRAYAANGKTSKTLNDKLSIVINKKGKVVNEQDMLKWVREKLADAIKESVDTNQVIKYAIDKGDPEKGVSYIPGVEVYTEENIRIASEL